MAGGEGGAPLAAESEQGRRVLREVVRTGSAGRAGEALLAGLPVRVQVRPFTELAPSLAGRSRAHLRALAGDIGLLARAEAMAGSRRWRDRLMPLTLAATVRGFGFERDLADGYFDPDLYLLGEVAARWSRAPGRWSLAAEAAPGVQRIGREGEPATAFRAKGTVAYEPGPGRRVALTALASSSGMQQLSAGSGDGYRYRAVTLSAGWVF